GASAARRARAEGGDRRAAEPRGESGGRHLFVWPLRRARDRRALGAERGGAALAARVVGGAQRDRAISRAPRGRGSRAPAMTPEQTREFQRRHVNHLGRPLAVDGVVGAQTAW